jgi:hypothetical protein
MAEPFLLGTNTILSRVKGKLEVPPESSMSSNTQSLIILMDEQFDNNSFFRRDAFEFKIYYSYSTSYHLPGQTNYIPYNFFSDSIIIIVKIYVMLNLFEIVLNSV